MSDLEAKLADHPFCTGLAPEHIPLLAGCAREVRYPAGDYLAREGTDADATYLITAGRVALRSGRDTVETIEDGELLGWSWLFEGTRWHVDAVATSATRAIRLDGPCLDRHMHDDPVFGHALARQLLLTAHRRLERARLRSLDTFGSRR
jgi:CRP/FNR family cyclic AMP-dependent transcriptional regulator